MASEISFQGFGPITKSNPTYSQGFGIDGSFAPAWTTEPKLRDAGSRTYSPLPQKTPWDLYSIGSDSGQTDYKVAPGLINSVLPSNWNSTFNVSNSSTIYFYVDCTFASGTMSTCTIQSASTPPNPQSIYAGGPPASLKIVFGVVSNGQVFNVLQRPSVSLFVTSSFTDNSDPAHPITYYYWTWS